MMQRSNDEVHQGKFRLNDEGDYDEEYEELGEYSIELDELP